jgi:hypothetical protein
MNVRKKMPLSKIKITQKLSAARYIGDNIPDIRLFV